MKNTFILGSKINSIHLFNRNTEQSEFNRGVRQCCILSLMLFNMHSEYIFGKALDGESERIKLNGENINNIR